MARQEFERRKAAAKQRLDDDWERAWKERRWTSLRHGAEFQDGAPGDLVVEDISRQRLAAPTDH